MVSWPYERLPAVQILEDPIFAVHQSLPQPKSPPQIKEKRRSKRIQMYQEKLSMSK